MWNSLRRPNSLLQIGDRWNSNQRWTARKIRPRLFSSHRNRGSATCRMKKHVCKFGRAATPASPMNGVLHKGIQSLGSLECATSRPFGKISNKQCGIQGPTPKQPQAHARAKVQRFASRCIPIQEPKFLNFTEAPFSGRRSVAVQHPGILGAINQ